MSTEEYLEKVLLPKVYASGRQVIGVPQHGPICQSGAKPVRDIAQRLRATGNTEIPVVFPGYELKSKDQIQVILLADPDAQDLQTLDTRVQEALQLRAGEWHESRLPVEDLLKTVGERFKDELVSLVVATGHKGILEDRDIANRNREIMKETREVADGFILSKPFALLDAFTQRVLQGREPDYGSVGLAYIQTSDARVFQDLDSSRISWLKLGSFTVEGLRQALLNNHTHVSSTAFSEPNIAILKLIVRKTVFFDEITLTFSPHLTSLVGGRGTGKSCLLEYIAHACEYPRAESYDRPNARILLLKRQEGTLLDDTIVELHVRLGSKYYRIQRKGILSPEIFECEDSRCQGGVLMAGAAPTSLLNLRLFGQRELANVVRNPTFFTLDPSQATGINLFTFLKSDQLSQVDELERKARSISGEIQKLSIDMASWARDLSERPKLLSEKERLVQDLERIKKQAAHPALQSHKDFLELARARDDLFETLTETSQQLRVVSQTIVDKESRIKILAPATETGAEASFQTIKEASIAQTEQLRQNIDSTIQSWEQDTQALRQSTENTIISEKLDDHSRSYELAKTELEAQKINLTLLEPLQKRIHEIEGRLQRFNEIDRHLTEARAQRLKLAKALRERRTAQGDVYEALARGITQSTNDRVKMEVIRAGDISRAVGEFQEQIRDKRRFRSGDVEELTRLIQKQSQEVVIQPAQLWTELVDNLLHCFEASQDKKLGRLPDDTEPPNCQWLGTLLDRLHELAAEFDDQQVGMLLCQYVPDSAVIHLRRRVDRDEYLPISQASVGQKATALFLILLAQTDGLIIIDQPEDDLDNAFITSDILPALEELKHRQQVIFATHNANMLVNAESEKIFVLDTEPRPTPVDDLPVIRGKIEYEGGIDQPKLRARITSILEGGQEAFLARERKYRFKQLS